MGKFINIDTDIVNMLLDSGPHLNINIVNNIDVITDMETEMTDDELHPRSAQLINELVRLRVRTTQPLSLAELWRAVEALVEVDIFFDSESVRHFEETREPASYLYVVVDIDHLGTENPYLYLGSRSAKPGCTPVEDAYFGSSVALTERNRAGAPLVRFVIAADKLNEGVREKDDKFLKIYEACNDRRWYNFS